MAQAWVDLAEQAERNALLFTVYETPEPRPAQSQDDEKLQPKD
jgi:hypothetical protein